MANHSITDKIVTLPALAAFKSAADSAYAAGNSSHAAEKAVSLPYATVDGTSTATAYTVTVPGITELYDGVMMYLRNTVVTSAAGFTVNVNNLGAKKCYNNMTNATQDTTIFNINYSMLFVYDDSLDEGNGGWWIYRGYDGNTNTIGYQVRTNSGNKVAADTGYRYRIWLTSADGSKWVPINTSSSTNATSNRSLNTRAIDPFGPIVYRATNGTCTSGTGIGATGIWQQYTLAIGYSYMASGFSLTFPAPVFLRCTPQTDGSATMQDIVQALPSSKDGKIYIHLGTAYSATNMELQTEHPVYWHDGTGIRIWTGAEPSSGGSPVAMTTQEIEDAVDEGWLSSGYTVVVSLTNPLHPSNFSSCTVREVNGTTGYDEGEQLGTISSPTGTGTFTMTGAYPYLEVIASGLSVGGGTVTCTGDVSFVGIPLTGMYCMSVTGSGTVTIDGIDYDD